MTAFSTQFVLPEFYSPNNGDAKRNSENLLRTFSIVVSLTEIPQSRQTKVAARPLMKLTKLEMKN